MHRSCSLRSTQQGTRAWQETAFADRDQLLTVPAWLAGETAEAEQKLEDEWGVFWALFKIRRGIQFAVHRREYEAMGTPYYRESWLRILSRMALAVVPGISDHFPGDYAAALRLAIFQRPAHGSDTEATP